MIVIRPVRFEDEDLLFELVAKSGMGITTLPHSLPLLKKKIENSINSFKKLEQSDNSKYFFVLENLKTKELAGCCAIYAKTGVGGRNDYFEIQIEHHQQHIEGQPIELKLLKHIDIQNGPSMLCSLYLSKDYRKGGLGRLLSFSRLMFIALFPQLFTTSVIATIRGFTDETGTSPFWEDVGRHFYDVDYDVILKLQEIDRDRVPDILPHNPIYVTLISREAQESIGKAHLSSVPALKILESEGFACTNDIDPYDAGPMLSAEVKNIRTVRLRQTATVAKISHPVDNDQLWMLSNNSFDFRACSGYLDIYENNTVCIDESVAGALNLKIGDTIHYVPNH